MSLWAGFMHVADLVRAPGRVWGAESDELGRFAHRRLASASWM
jgi:hypothetical protein